MDKEKLTGLITEVTGLEQGNPTVRAIRGSFEALKGYADFDTPDAATQPEKKKKIESTKHRDGTSDEHEFELGLSYTINLVLPKTDDVAVFNAIFRSLRENLLRK